MSAKKTKADPMIAVIQAQKRLQKIPRRRPIRSDRKADHAFLIFKGCDTDQTDHGKPACPNKWYFEPLYHDSKELWSAGYDSAEEAGEAIGDLYDETEDVE